MINTVGTTNTISINQVGYRPQDAKIAVFQQTGGSFYLEDAAGQRVWSGEAAGPIQDKPSGQTLFHGDFTAYTKPGIYRIVQPGVGASEPFAIGEQPYKQLHKGLLKAFYFFRCGTELTEPYAGQWTHKECHMTPAIVYGQEHRRIDVCGGWHDAGDFGKYSGPGAKAIADMLLAFELYPQSFAEAVPLPETDGRTPDVLHECRFELEFLLKMQDEETDGVFHKVTTLRFPSYHCMPEDDLADLYLSPISATATGCFAGIMAMAARTYRPYDAGFAETCLQAAVRAYKWLERNPVYPGFKNPPEIFTGEYGDKQDKDERYWAAAELYRTTGEQAYHAAMEQLANESSFDLNQLGWADMGGYGTIAYLLMDEAATNPQLRDKLKKGFIAAAHKLVDLSEQDGYLISLTLKQYIWGSNMIVMNNAMHMLIAHYFAPDARLERCALEHVHYLLGRNVMGLSYVTGFGSKAIMNPHYRPTMGERLREPVPGQVSGGPNLNLQDDHVRGWSGLAPAQCFADHEESYSTNEVTIYWNSPAVFVVSYFLK